MNNKTDTRALFPAATLWAIDTAVYSMPSMRIDAGLMREISAQLSTRPMATLRGSTAIIDVVGPVEKRASLVGEVMGFASSERIRRGLEVATADDSVDTILLRVDSPGGTVDGLADLADAVFAARESKKVIAQVDGMAASAAYWIASQANAVFAGRTDLVGSIGIKLMLMDASKLAEAQGIEVIPIVTGDMKAAGEFGTPITPEQRAMFQGLVDSLFDDFLKAVGRGRGMALSDVKKAASGEVFLAGDAKKLGLIDKVQTLDQTLAQLDSRSRGRAMSRRARAEFELAGA